MFASSVIDHVFIGGVMANMFHSSVVDHVFNHYTTDEHMIYHTWVKHVSHYTTAEHMIYHTFLIGLMIKNWPMEVSGTN
jgi:hypothetical protein